MLHDILNKAYNAGLTYAEIGAALGLTRQRVQQLRHNASDNNKHTQALISAAKHHSDSLRWSEIIDD